MLHYKCLKEWNTNLCACLHLEAECGRRNRCLPHAWVLAPGPLGASLLMYFHHQAVWIVSSPAFCFIIQHLLQKVRKRKKLKLSLQKFQTHGGCETGSMGLRSRGLELFAYCYPEVSTGCQASVFTSQGLNFLSSLMESLYQFWEPMNPIYLSILSKLNYRAVAVGQVHHHSRETEKEEFSVWETGWSQ